MNLFMTSETEVRFAYPLTTSGSRQKASGQWRLPAESELPRDAPLRTPPHEERYRPGVDAVEAVAALVGDEDVLVVE